MKDRERARDCRERGTVPRFALVFRGLYAGVVLYSACLVWACRSGNAPPVTPEATVVAFSRALSQSKFEEAYALMSDDYKKRVSLEQFKQRAGENPEETIELGNALSRVRKSATEEAVIAYGDDQELRLRRNGKRWLILTGLVDFYDQSTPRAALRAFVRAMERKRYDVVLRLIPSADKEGITEERMEQAWSGEQREEVERLLGRLREHLDDPIEVIGNHATMPYGDHVRVQFVREGNAWKIEDPE